jgi:hypothetical protein
MRVALHERPADAQLISAADKLHNARGIRENNREVGSPVWKRFKRAGMKRSGISMNSWQSTNLLERNGSLKDGRV